MAAVEAKNEVTTVESEKSAEDLKSQNASTPVADPEKSESEAPKESEQEQSANGHDKDGKQETEAKAEGDPNPLGTTVAKHYNEHPEGTKDSRKESRIFHMRNFNNWVKSVLINEFLQKIKRFNYKNIHVLDLCCGKGGDLLKWQRGRIRKLVCADIAKVSVDQAQERYKEMKQTAEERRYRDPLFDTQFLVADCTKERLADQFEEDELVFDLTSCQFSFHYSFESYEQADMMLKNACEKLKPGGYFIGTTPNAYELVNKVKQAEGLEFGNDVYKIKFENKDEFPLYGCKYDFHLEDAVDCPEFLVYFPLLQKMARKYSMDLMFVKTFHEFFQERSQENMSLLSKMNALETYPPRREGDKSISPSEESYSHAKDFVEGLQSGKTDSSTSKYRDHRERSQKYVGTLSKEEWEAVGMYIVFAFVKVDKIDEENKDNPSEDTATESAATSATATTADDGKAADEASTKADVETSASTEEATTSRKRKLDDGKSEEATDEPATKKQETDEPAAKKQETGEPAAKKQETDEPATEKQETEDAE